MKRLSVMLAVLTIMLAAGSAGAFECPNHFAKAEGAIASATEAMDEMPDGDEKGLVHTLIDDAKAWLESAKHNHEKPAAGAYDHARSIAKAHSAMGYANAARMMAEH